MSRLRPLPILLLLAACTAEPTPAPTSDSDGDGVLDVHEGMEDADGDGVANHLDLDSDGDGWTDAQERGDDDLLTYPVDTDLDGVIDLLDLDSDGNGIPDADERFRSQALPDPDGDGILDPHDLDDDGDGAPDLLEMAGPGRDLDTDGDGDADRYDTDSDDDGILDAIEAAPLRAGLLHDDDDDGTPDLRDLDADGDGLSDADERGEGPEPADHDGDGRIDARDRDSDNDGLADLEDDRVAVRTKADADGDGVRDGTETQLGSDPRNRLSVPTLPLQEVRARVDHEESLVLQTRLGEPRVDLIFLFTGASHETCGGKPEVCYEWKRLAVDVLAGTVDRFTGRRAAVAIGLGLIYHRVFLYGSVTRGALYPLHGVTADGDSLLSSLADWPPYAPSEAQGDGGLLAVDQVLTGTGYDRDCDGIYQAAVDVRPWVREPSDPFAGSTAGNSTIVPVGGPLPGLGRTPYAMPIVVMAYRGALTDPGGPLGGHGPVADAHRGCPREPTSVQISAHLDTLGGRLVYLDLYGVFVNRPFPQGMSQFFDIFDMYADDGTPLVAHGDLFDGDLAAERIAAHLETIVDAAIASRTFSTVEFAVAGDDHGFVTSFSPQTAAVVPEAELDVTVTLRGVVPPLPTDQVFELELVAAGDGKVALGSQPFYVVVPGTGLD